MCIFNHLLHDAIFAAKTTYRLTEDVIKFNFQLITAPDIKGLIQHSGISYNVWMETSQFCTKPLVLYINIPLYFMLSMHGCTIVYKATAWKS